MMTSDRIKEDCEFMLGEEGTGVPDATQLPEGEFEFSMILRPFKMIPQSMVSHKCCQQPLTACFRSFEGSCGRVS